MKFELFVYKKRKFFLDRVLLLFLLLGIISSITLSCKKIKYSSNTTIIDIDAKRFVGFDFDCPVEMNIVRGDSNTVTIETNENFYEFLKFTETSNGFKVQRFNDGYKYTGTFVFKVTASIDSLLFLRFNEGGSVNDFMTRDDTLKLFINRDFSAVFDSILSPKVEIWSSAGTTGNIVLNGSLDTLKIDYRGQNTLNLINLNGNYGEINYDTPLIVELGSFNHFKARGTGGGVVNYGIITTLDLDGSNAVFTQR